MMITVMTKAIMGVTVIITEQIVVIGKAEINSKGLGATAAVNGAASGVLIMGLRINLNIAAMIVIMMSVIYIIKTINTGTLII